MPMVPIIMHIRAVSMTKRFARLKAAININPKINVTLKMASAFNSFF
jgi:hypothetical protein